MPITLPAGWAEIADPTEGRDPPLRHFEASYQVPGDDPRAVQVASRDDSDDACLAAISEAEKNIARQGGKVVA